MSSSIKSALLEIIGSAHGLFVITGPTGSGKTTTLYSCLNELNTPQRKVFTIENPVEYTIENVQHVNVDRMVTFNSALKSCLRQDPDIILVGEIRDSETAKTAIQAAQTGHLVLTTLHTNSSVGAISRLIELGIDAGHLNETLLGVIAQRLVRRCVDARNVDEVSSDHKDWLRKNGFAHLTDKPFGRGESNELYSGRIPVLEMLVMNDDIRQALTLNKFEEIYDLAEKQPQYKTLSQAAVELALEGKTSLDQAISISGASTKVDMSGMLLGERLLMLNYLTEFQLDYAREIQRQAPEISRKPLAEILVEHHFCSIEQIKEVGDAPDL